MEIHDWQLSASGGTDGVRSEELLESALDRPRTKHAYGNPQIHDLAAAYAAGICKNHPFVDGKKRTAFSAAAAFLHLNGYELTLSATQVHQSMENLATDDLSEADFASLLKRHMTPV